MEDARTLWLTIANIALAVVVVAALITVSFAFLYEVIARRRKQASLYGEMDRDLSRLLR